MLAALLWTADRALNDAKRAGRNTIPHPHDRREQQPMTLPKPPTGEPAGCESDRMTTLRRQSGTRRPAVAEQRAAVQVRHQQEAVMSASAVIPKATIPPVAVPPLLDSEWELDVVIVDRPHVIDDACATDDGCSPSCASACAS